MDPAYERLLPELRDPVDKGLLRLAEPAELERARQALSEGSLETRAGATVEQDFEQLLITEDARHGYPIRGGIPILLSEEALRLGGSGAD